jgi:hypothetical protein
MPVYFARSGTDGAVKIGYARDPKRRLSLLQTGNPERLVMIRLIAGDLADEAEAHRHFADIRLSGEWFSFTEEMLTYGTETVGFDPAKRRGPAAQFHPIVQEIVAKANYSEQQLNHWRKRGVPYRVCLEAYAMADERGTVSRRGDLAEFRKAMVNDHGGHLSREWLMQRAAA